MKLRSFFLGALASLPFAVSAGTADVDLEPAIARAADAQIALDAASDMAPPADCGALGTTADKAATDQAVKCCWVFFMGSWRCVPCAL
jgi:hypothetical protein